MHTVTVYTIRCPNPEKRGKDDQYFKLNNVKGNDLFALIVEFIDSKKNAQNDLPDEKKVYLFSNLKIENEKRTISGWIEAGSYGSKSDIVDVKKGELAFEKRANNAEIIKYYFRIVIPTDLDEGLALFHSYKGLGVKTIFYQEFSKYIQTKNIQSFQLYPTTDGKAVDQWKKATPSEIRLTDFSGEMDLADKLKGLGHVEKKVIIKVTKASILSAFGTLENYYDSETEQGRLVEVISPLCSKIQVEAKMNNRKRVFTVGISSDDAGFTIDVDDTVEISEDVPNFDSFDKWAIELMSDLRSNIGPEESR